MIGCVLCLNENSRPGLLILLICTFPHFSETSALKSQALTTSLPTVRQSPTATFHRPRLTCELGHRRCLVSAQQPDSSQVSRVVALRPRPRTVKAVIIAIAAANLMKYLSGCREDVMSFHQATCQVKGAGIKDRMNDSLHDRRHQRVLGDLAPYRTFWRWLAVRLDGGPGS